MALTLRTLSDRRGFIERGARDPLDAFEPDASGPRALALRYALVSSNDEEVARCLAEGADPFVLDAEGANLLHNAALGGSVSSIARLLVLGLNPNQVSQSGSTPLYEAVWAGRTDAVHALLNAGAAPHPEPVLDDPPVLLAARRGNAPILRALLDAGAPVHARTRVTGPSDATALHLAARISREGVKALMAAGADVHAQDAIGRRPIHEAADPGILGLLIAHGADPNDTGSAQCPVYPPIIMSSAAAMRVLLDAGARVDVTGPGGRTVASLAATYGDLPLVQRVIGLGAATGTPGGTGRPAFWAAAAAGHAHVVSWLIDHGHGHVNDRDAATGGTAFMAAAWQGSIETLQALSHRGADTRAIDKLGRSALHYAVEKGWAAVIDWLIKAGLELERADAYGATPLHLAAQGGLERVIEQLLVAGASLYARNAHGNTPIEVALSGQVPDGADDRKMVPPERREVDPFYGAVKVLLAAELAAGLSTDRARHLKTLAVAHRPPDVVAELF